MSTFIEKLLAQQELLPDKHDGSYELVRETVKALSNITVDKMNIEDLDMLYLMTIGTWKSSFENKKQKITESNIKEEDKSHLIELIDTLHANAKNHLYENVVENGSIGMFGTGFFTFRTKISEGDAKKFLRLCVEINSIEDEDIIFQKAEELLKNNIKGMGVASVSQILHCLKPFVFPIMNNSDDAGIQAYKILGVDLIKPKELPYYIQNVRKIRDFRDRNFTFKNYRVIDMVLWNENKDITKGTGDKVSHNNFWLFNVCIKAKEIWDYCKANSCFAMQYEYNKQDNASVTRNINVAKEVRAGDLVVAYTGDQRIVAIGEVVYEFYEETDKSKYIYEDEGWAQRIGVQWNTIMEEPVFVGDFNKTLGLLEPSKLRIQAINKLSEEGYNKATVILNSTIPIKPSKPANANYWWLYAKPSIWSFDNIEVGETIEYTSHTDEGTKRRIYKYFDEAEVGDLVIGYDASPIKAIVAICKVVRKHDGETIKFEKIRKIENPIGLDMLREVKELSDMEPLHGPIGSLFKVKPSEYETIIELVNSKNAVKEDVAEQYTKNDLLNEVFIGEEKYEQIMFDLTHKKNLILQGPPGVGKTFVAKRLAYSRMGVKDDSRIQMIQFHQSYSYEDFIQGFRPSEDGKFKLKNGVFYEFCRKAQRDSEHDYYFIIDEINRGNLSKIFGELMMLIEHDKRGKEFEIPLTYAQDEDDKFYIPENLYLIGTMNTADRSLAMVDYALRRRFRFIDIEPAFSEDAFKDFLRLKGIEEQLINRIVINMERLNLIISSDNKNLGKGYRIGHSYFCDSPKQSENHENWYNRIVLSEIKPLLYEYWFDDEETAEAEVKALL